MLPINASLSLSYVQFILLVVCDDAMQDEGDDDPDQLATEEVAPADSTSAAEVRLISCAVCSKAKSKCIRQAGQKDCDR